MVQFKILAGGYSAPGFVAFYLFDSIASTLNLVAAYFSERPSAVFGNAAYSLIFSAVNENERGALQSFTVSGQALSAPISTTASEGNGPPFTLGLSTGEVAVVNPLRQFGSGTGAFLPSDDGQNFGSAQAITFPVQPGTVDNVSHPHMVLENNGEVLIPDLGADMIWRLASNGSAGSWQIAGQLPQPQGSGPRHIAILDGYLYTVHETASTVTSQPLPDAINGTSNIITTIDIRPQDAPADAHFGAGELVLCPPNQLFPKPYLYASNRNVGPTQDPAGDTIAIIEIGANGTMTLVSQVKTGINQPRGVEKGGDDDEFLAVGGVVGTGGVAIFNRTEGGANLAEVARNTQVPTRTSFVWLEV
ncbi:hypothetical protein EWM64_g660 [Hericium alpestre]|uniref:Isomerase YbhE n=1 Tax=Hericium alpestre TaxID=135208 RepID=A0A4Z0AAJ6_9AGAM|nr:hypothetical protein EWM64_g660 [Hericium alpestre]